MKKEYDVTKREWGKRVRSIANLVDTSYSMGTIVGNIADTDQAIDILRKIKDLAYSEEIFNYLLSIKKGRKIRINKAEKWLIWKLSKLNVSEILISQLNWNPKFFGYLANIIKNKM